MSRCVSILAAAVMGLSVLVLGARAATAADPPLETQFVSLINADRAHGGLPPLTVDPQLVAVARGWSDTLERAGSLSHNPDIEHELPDGWTRWGENVGTGPSVASLEAAFMASAEHRANILGAFTLVGVGVDVTTSGVVWVTVDFAALGPGVVTVSCTDTNPPPSPSPAAASGYYVLGSDGGVFSYGSAVFHGSVPGLGLRARTTLMAVTRDDGGYWLLGSDGGVFTFGDAGFFGSVPGTGSQITAVDLKPTPSGKGYWVLGADGGIFSFGDAAFHGSVPGIGCQDASGVQLAATSTGQGYYVLTSDGRVFPFGDAPGHGDPSSLGVSTVDLAVLGGSASAPSGG